MSAPSSLARRGLRHVVSVTFGLAASAVPGHAQDPFIFGGIPIDNPSFSFLVNEFGYSDSMLDQRPMFLGREYLSGEWAAAIYYEGGNLPATARWLPDRFVFPDFLTPEPHFTSNFDPPFMGYGPNAYGFNVFGSTVMNGDIEVRMTYETLDLGEDMADRLAIGLSRQSLGGAGSFLPSERYVYRQTYDIKNITDNTLSNVRIHQFLHTLHGDWGVYDGRDYGGGMSDYRYGITLQGKSLGFDQQTNETVEHTDTVTVKHNLMPSGFELGAFGMKNEGDHQIGEPAVGVHKSVAANSLNGNDFFDPDESDPGNDAWVAGALAVDLGSLQPDESKSLDMLVAIHTTYQVVHPPIKLVVRQTSFADGTLTIDFEETTNNPLVGFILRRSETLDETPLEEWNSVGVPYLLDIPFLNWRRFRVPVDQEAEPSLLFYIHPTIINEE